MFWKQINYSWKNNTQSGLKNRISNILPDLLALISDGKSTIEVQYVAMFPIVKTSSFQDKIIRMDGMDDSRVYCGESDR